MRRADALEQLAVLGGKLVQESDIVFEGTQFRLPAHLSLDESIDHLVERRDFERAEVSFPRTFPYRPWDGAIATAKAVRQGCGFLVGKAIRSFWGSQPPQIID